MAVEVASLKATLGADASGFVAALEKTEAGLKKLGADTQAFAAKADAFDKAALKAEAFNKKIKSIGDEMGKLGTKMTLMVTLPIVGMFTASIKAASDMAESTNKMEVVFGKASKAVTAFSADSAKSMGLSKQATIDATSTFGNLFIGMGAGQQKAADMSTTLVKLAADLGSFHNIAIGDALIKLRAGLIGETEPMRSLGVIINEATVKAKALQMGLGDARGEISESAKVTARYTLILEGTKTAHGDFINTADNLANKTKTATASLQDATAAMGESLIPMAITAATEVTDLANAFTAMPVATQNAVVGLLAVTAAAGPLLKVLSGLVSAALFLKGVLPGIGVALAGLLSAPVALLIAIPAALVAALAAVTNTAATAGKAAEAAAKAADPAAYIKKQIAEYKASQILLEQAMAPGAGATLFQGETWKAQIAELQTYIVALEAELTNLGTAGAAGLGAIATAVDAATVPLAGALEALSGYSAAIKDSDSAAKALKDALDSGNPILIAQATVLNDAALKAEALAKGLYNAAMMAEQLSGAMTSGMPIVGGTVALTHEEAIAQRAAQWKKFFGPTSLVPDNKEGNAGVITGFTSAATSAAQRVVDAFNRFATAVTTAINGAMSAAKGLADMTGGPGGGMAPGQNGPFERLFRTLDVAVKGAASPWAATEGGDQGAAIAASKAFQQGNLLAPGVFEKINWQQLGEMTKQQDESAKISTYAGQAVAGLMAAGKPLTAENMKAAIDSLAAADKDNIVPKLTDIWTAIDVLGGDSDLAKVVAAVNNVGAIMQGKMAPTKTNTTKTTLEDTAGGRGERYASGTSFARGGWAIVGEKGPELTYVPRGAQVYSSAESRNLMGRLAAAIDAKAEDIDAMAEALIARASGQVMTSMMAALGR